MAARGPQNCKRWVVSTNQHKQKFVIFHVPTESVIYARAIHGTRPMYGVAPFRIIFFVTLSKLHLFQQSNTMTMCLEGPHWPSDERVSKFYFGATAVP